MYLYDNSLRINFAAIAYQRNVVCQCVFLSCSVKSGRHYATTVSLHTMLWCQKKEVVVILSLTLGDPIEHTLLTNNLGGCNSTYAIFRQLRTQINPPTTKHSSWWFVRPCEVWKMIMLCMGPRQSKTGGFRRWWKSVLFGTSRFHVGLGWVFYLGRNTACIEWTMTGCIGSWRLVYRERERVRWVSLLHSELLESSYTPTQNVDAHVRYVYVLCISPLW